jgi:hypothetical protein
LKLRDEDEVEINALDKGGATPPTAKAEATVTSILVIELDWPESSIVRAEAEVKTLEKPTSTVTASVGGATRSIDAQARSSGEATGPTSRPFVGLRADMARPSNRPFVGLGVDTTGPSNRSFPDSIEFFRPAREYEEASEESVWPGLL